MQLREARLCANCDEVHDEPYCPHCTSDQFHYLTRWVPLPEERMRPRPTTSPAAEAYRQLINPAEKGAKPRMGSIVKRGVVGLTAVSVFGLLWRSAARARAETTKPE
jgi:hypothetical protein